MRPVNGVLTFLSLLPMACHSASPDVAPLTISKETTYITEPLAADGTPDYAAWLNRKYGAGVTPENNAAEKLMRLSNDITLAPTKGAGSQLSRSHLAPWKPADAPLVAEWLKSKGTVLDEAAALLRDRPRYFEPIPEDFGTDTSIPSRLGLRRLSDAWLSLALLRLADGDHAGARADVENSIALAAHLDQGHWLIDRLVAVAVRSSALQTVFPLANPPKSKGDARALVAMLERLPESPPLQDVLLDTQRVLVLGGYMNLYRRARVSDEAWRSRIGAIQDAEANLAKGLGEDAPMAEWTTIPRHAIDWDELMRTANRCWQNPECDGLLEKARADLEPGRLNPLIEQAKADAEARRKLAHAFIARTPRSSTARASVSWNEAQAMFGLALASASAGSTYADGGRYPAPGPPVAPRPGYVLRCATATSGKTFACSAVPEEKGVSGVRSFCADSTGRIAYDEDGNAPAIDGALCDPVLTTLAAWTPPKNP